MDILDPTDRAAQVLRALIDSAVDGIIVIDAQGRIETFNPAAERLFGYRQEEVAGRNVTVLMPSPYREEHDRYLSRYLETGHAKIIGIGREVTGLRRDGTTFPLHLSVGEFEIDGEMHGDAAISEEIRGNLYPSSRLKGEANLLIMPTLDAANIAFNLLKTAAGDGITVGPILLGCAGSVHIMTPSATVRRIVNMTALTVVDAGAQRGEQRSLL